MARRERTTSWNWIRVRAAYNVQRTRSLCALAFFPRAKGLGGDRNINMGSRFLFYDSRFIKQLGLPACLALRLWGSSFAAAPRASRTGLLHLTRGLRTLRARLLRHSVAARGAREGPWSGQRGCRFAAVGQTASMTNLG